MATSSSGSSGRVKWLSDLDKTVLVSNFDRRGWVKGSSEGEQEIIGETSCLIPDGDWNFYW